MHPSRLACSKRVCVLSLALLLPGVALGAADAPQVPPEAAGKPRPPPPKPAAPELRIPAQVGLGLVTGASVGFVVGLYGLRSCSANNHSHDCDARALNAALVGTTLGYGMGVWIGGELMDTDGRVWPTLLGAGLGFALGIPALGEGGFRGVPLLLGMVGAHIGYEVSKRPAPSTSEPGLSTVRPLLSVSPQGARLGLSGRF